MTDARQRAHEALHAYRYHEHDSGLAGPQNRNCGEGCEAFDKMKAALDAACEEATESGRKEVWDQRESLVYCADCGQAYGTVPDGPKESVLMAAVVLENEHNKICPNMKSALAAAHERGRLEGRIQQHRDDCARPHATESLQMGNVCYVLLNLRALLKEPLLKEPAQGEKA